MRNLLLSANTPLTTFIEILQELKLPYALLNKSSPKKLKKNTILILLGIDSLHYLGTKHKNSGILLSNPITIKNSLNFSNQAIPIDFTFNHHITEDGREQHFYSTQKITRNSLKTAILNLVKNRNSYSENIKLINQDFLPNYLKYFPMPRSFLQDFTALTYSVENSKRETFKLKFIAWILAKSTIDDLLKLTKSMGKRESNDKVQNLIKFFAFDNTLRQDIRELLLTHEQG